MTDHCKRSVKLHTDNASYIMKHCGYYIRERLSNGRLHGRLDSVKHMYILLNRCARYQRREQRKMRPQSLFMHIYPGFELSRKVMCL